MLPQLSAGSYASRLAKATYALTAGSEFNAMATRADDLCPDVDWPRRTRVNRNKENDDALEA